MTIEIKFTPQRLKALVAELERRIGVATGPPLRLDLEIYLNSLRKYKANPTKENLPTIACLERLATLIPKVQEEELFESFIDCLRHSTNPRITTGILDYYFNNYSDILAKSYLLATIHTEVLDKNGWEIWSRNREVFFKDDVTNNIANFIIKYRIPLQEVPERLGMPEPYSIREDSLSCLCEDNNLLESYLKVLPLQSILTMLNDVQLQRLHTSIWNYSLPAYGPEAKRQKIRLDTDHPLFALAKLSLQPTKSPQWLRLSKEAQEAYQDWALGARLEAFFEKDTNNQRIIFWKRYIRNIDSVKEVKHRGSIEAFAIAIGKYEFIEFRKVGAIYVYPKGAVRIPNRVNNLDKELKFREKVVNPGMGVERGEGWIAHRGRVWPERANRLINEALRK